MCVWHIYVHLVLIYNSVLTIKWLITADIHWKLSCIQTPCSCVVTSQFSICVEFLAHTTELIWKQGCHRVEWFITQCDWGLYNRGQLNTEKDIHDKRLVWSQEKLPPNQGKKPEEELSLKASQRRLWSWNSSLQKCDFIFLASGTWLWPS